MNVEFKTELSKLEISRFFFVIHALTSWRYRTTNTERDELQDVEHLKRIAPPPTAQTIRAIGLIFGLGVLWRDISGATVAIFEFPS